MEDYQGKKKNRHILILNETFFESHIYSTYQCMTHGRINRLTGLLGRLERQYMPVLDKISPRKREKHFLKL